MQRPVPDTQSNFEMTLRDQLIAAQAGAQESDHQHHQPAPQHSHLSAGSPIHEEGNGHIDSTLDAGDHASFPMEGMGIEDTIAAMSGQSGSAAAAAANRRELSSSKRAAQNRAAQRAFRQRKEAYIGKLEKQVKDYRDLEQDYKALSDENYQLREYILSLQSRILETSSELPPPPASVNLSGPGIHSREQRQLPRSHLLEQEQHQQQQEQPPHLAEVQQRDLPQGQDHDKAPTALMSRPPPESLPQAAVEQLRAAAAEAGELGGPAAPISEK